MTGYLESQAASAPKQSLPHYAEAQRRARRAAGEQRARRLSRGLGGRGLRSASWTPTLPW
jgi:hypothetical protein